MTYHQISDEDLDEFIKISEKEGHKYKDRDEARASAQNLVRFAELALEVSMDVNRRNQRLKNEPDGFVFEGEGRTCLLCHRSVTGDMWWDKWGQQCMDCHEAHKKKIIPGYVFKDDKNEKHITSSDLNYKFGIKHMTLKKLVREGKLKPRIVNGNNLYVFLKRDNPNLPIIIEESINKT